MINYLIELSVIHTVLILGYGCFLRKERQYAKMRFYLIAATILALTIPFFKLPKLSFHGEGSIDTIPIEVIPIDDIAVSPAGDMSTWNYGLFIWIYGVISAFFLFKFFGGVLYLFYLEHKSSYEKFNDLYVRKVSNIKGSFTFFNWIFLSDKINKNRQDYGIILRHEKAHAALGHTYDLIFFELFKVCFWWLPGTWYVNKEIRKIHEYQADAYALKSCNIDQYSSILISTTLKSNGLGLASSFHDGLILKRLIAMKQQAKDLSPWKLGALSVLCALLFIVFACSEEQTDSPHTNQLFSLVEELPEFEGGMDAFYQYVGKEIKYPLQARQIGIGGHVFVRFVVEKDGSLSGVKSVKGIGAGCDREVIRAIQNAPSFKPGKQRGKPVRVQMVMPVTFTLLEDKINGRVVVAEAKIIDSQLKVEANYNNGAWSGTVYDEEGEGLPGANIMVAGTTTGTVSDRDGNFMVNADESRDLRVSFVGYESVKIAGN
ncbi:TonB family protein [Fulvivirgaceae bacterium BMA12]|uniref:TonB family protein n=1 Tax=Agaribacillus aureus TaxID=3051825 RepID=A0ABT8L7G3_9BACT|nr:TonB family protein [Fulvivirgaceae bacterium BMA12]